MLKSVLMSYHVKAILTIVEYVCVSLNLVILMSVYVCQAMLKSLLTIPGSGQVKSCVRLITKVRSG